MGENYYVKDYNHDGYCVCSRGQGDCRVATFVCEEDAKDFCKYRNKMLKKYGTSDVKKYKH